MTSTSLFFAFGHSFFLLLYFPYRILAASAFIKQCLLIFFRSTITKQPWMRIQVYSIAIINWTLGGTKEMIRPVTVSNEEPCTAPTQEKQEPITESLHNTGHIYKSASIFFLCP